MAIQLANKHLTFVATVAVLYAFVCVIIARDAVVPAIKLLPDWLFAVLVTITGPAVLLSLADSIGVFFVALAAVACCLGVARICWQLWPLTEWFAVPLVAAALIWCASGWLAVIAGV